MAYLIDSDWVIDHLKQIPEANQLLSSLAPEGMYISVISYMEVFQGTLRAEDVDEAQRELADFVSQIDVLPFIQPIAERCARIRNALSDQGKRPTRRGMDLLIAATALEHDLTLVTRNFDDYKDIPELMIYEP